MRRTQPAEVPYGTCHCGCGAQTSTARTDDPHGRFKRGEPRWYLKGHHTRVARAMGEAAAAYVVEDHGYETPCWMATRGEIYGKVYREGRDQNAHRWFYEQKHGSLKDRSVHLHHLCGVKRCCNPDHVTPHTVQDHVRLGPNAKLTVAAVREIRESTETHQALAEKFGVGRQTIYKVRKRLVWREVDGGGITMVLTTKQAIALAKELHDKPNHAAVHKALVGSLSTVGLLKHLR